MQEPDESSGRPASIEHPFAKMSVFSPPQDLAERGLAESGLDIGSVLMYKGLKV